MRPQVITLYLCLLAASPALVHSAQFSTTLQATIQFTDQDRQFVARFYQGQVQTPIQTQTRYRYDDDDGDEHVKHKKRHKHKHHDHDDDDDGDYDHDHDEHGKHNNTPPGLAKREALPPGLQMQLQRNGTLPPGLQGRGLPVDLERKLGRLPDHNYVRVIVDHDIVLMDKRNRLILDVIHDIVR
ncbi:MAG: hypothetical protein HY080_00360 [Gammaproteobacteria bacterium]|nr:hypothetical protein [Gammaproteobacteria bacterium]